MVDFGIIVLVPFPFTDLSSTKVRPAMIVSKKSSGDDVIVCFISSKIDPSSMKCGMLLHPDDHNGLKVISAVRFDKIATLSKNIILGELGCVDVAVLKNHAAKFRGVFGF